MRFHERLIASISLAALAGCAAEAAPPRAPSGGGDRRFQAEVAAKPNEAQPAQFGKDEADAPAGAATPPMEPRPSDAKARVGGHAGSAPGAGAGAGAAAEVRDLVIYTAQLAMAVHQVDAGIAAVERIAKESGGYLASKKDREIVIRVPRARFEAALAKIDTTGDVIHRDIAAVDVTDEHVDLEIRIKNARSMQKHFADLLARANVKEAIEIEKELGRVTEELERLEGKLKLLNDRVAFSTITVAFEARGHTLQTQRVRLPFSWMNGLNLPTLMNLGEDK